MIIEIKFLNDEGVEETLLYDTSKYFEYQTEAVRDFIITYCNEHIPDRRN